jgi:hypothetical protein
MFEMFEMFEKVQLFYFYISLWNSRVKKFLKYRKYEYFNGKN